MHIRSALIPAAGFGTRFLPITKTIQKEMLPILGRPLIDYVVDDLIQAGVERIIMVVSEHNNQIPHFYRKNKRLHNYLATRNKLPLYDQVKTLHEKAEFIFIRQPDEGEYGTAVPVRLAEPYLKDEEAFFVFMGDDFLFNAQDGSESGRMLALLNQTGAQSLATCITKPSAELFRYGVVRTEQRGDITYYQSMVEKPPTGTEPSNLINVSKYIFTPAIFDIINRQSVDSKSGELYIIDSLNTYAQDHSVVVYQPQGEYLDGGNPQEWLKANMTVAAADPTLKAQMRGWLA